MDAEIIPFKNSDGSGNALQLYIHDQQEAPVILIMPALGMRAAHYTGFAAALSQKGYHTAIVDLRGKGLSDVRPSRQVDFGYQDILDGDMTSAFSVLNERFPLKRPWILGHSLGGQLGCLYASAHPQEVSGLILVACCSVHYQGWPGLKKYAILAGTQMAGIVSGIMGYFPGHRLGFGGMNAKTLMKDWSNQSRTGQYVLANSTVDYEEALNNLSIPAYAFSFEADHLSPAAAVDRLLDKLNPNADKRHLHMDASHPQNERYNHFSWLKRPDGLVTAIDEHLRSGH